VERRMIEDQSTNPAEIMVALRTELPRGFKWTDVNRRLCNLRGLLIEGIDAIGDSGGYLPDVERAIVHIAEKLAQKPDLNEIRAAALSEELRLPPARAEQILGLIAACPGYSTGSNPSPRGASSISLGGTDVLAAYLAFQNVRDLLNDLATAHGIPAPSTAPIPSQEIPERASNRNTAFIVMAMDPNDHSLTDVCNTIKEACKEFGIEAYRADDIEHQDRITDKVLEHIASAEFIIADLTYERQNVYYEIGYAHALRKRPILVRKAGTTLHFDLSVHNAPEYRNNTDLRAILLKRFEAILGRPPKTVS
jgi:nucleoside 2-deoxyribosyltransferase